MEKENKYNPESEVEQIIAKREQEWYRPWETEKEMRRLFTEAGKPLIEELGRAPLPTEFGNWTHIAFGDFTTGRIHDLLVYGNIAEGSLGDGESILARVHDTCKSGDTLSASNCDCGKELHETMRMIQEEERGVILYLDQEGRGAGPAGKMEQVNGMCEWKNGDILPKSVIGEAYRTVDYRDYTVAGQVLRHAGIRSIRLLTNNPRKVKGIRKSGIHVTPVELHIDPDNELMVSDLRSKAEHFGHTIPEETFLSRPDNRS